MTKIARVNTGELPRGTYLFRDADIVASGRIAYSVSSEVGVSAELVFSQVRDRVVRRLVELLDRRGEAGRRSINS